MSGLSTNVIYTSDEFHMVLRKFHFKCRRSCRFFKKGNNSFKNSMIKLSPGNNIESPLVSPFGNKYESKMLKNSLWFSPYMFINVRTFNQCDIYFCLSCLSTSCLCFVCLFCFYVSLFIALWYFALCLVCPMVPVFLDCQFMVDPLKRLIISSDSYKQKHGKLKWWITRTTLDWQLSVSIYGYRDRERLICRWRSLVLT
jgi:hypothetical protein